MKTALITSTGSVATDITIKSLRRMGFKIVGCNIYPKEWIVESCEVDVFYKVPPVADQENYLNTIHEICEKESLLAAVSKKIEYYDDEELDRFRGRPSNGYNEEEVEEFREIMYTCKEDEVAGWSRSLQLRGIELPDELKDELFLIVGERRFK